MGCGLLPGSRLADLAAELDAIFALHLPFDAEGEAVLARWLYEHCYTRSILATAEALTPPASDGDGELLPALAQANQSRPGWEEGWHVEHATTRGRILARKNGSLRSFAAGEYISSQGPGCGPEAEGPLLVFRVSESKTLQPAYYHVFGETICPFEEHTGIVRCYWNIGAEAAAKLVESVTQLFNRFQIPFQLKVPKGKAGYARRDTAVLYIHRWYFPITALLLESVYTDLAGHLKAETPLFTKQLAPGMALAEDPAGESFGRHRCRLLARALLRSGDVSAPGKMQALEEEFRREGLSLGKPWLNAGCNQEYPYPFPTA